MKTRIIPVGLACWVLMFPGLSASETRAGAGDAPELPPLPANAIAVVYIRAGDIWQSDPLKQFRDLLAKAGPEMLSAFDERFVPAPSSMDRIVVVISKSSKANGQPLITFFLTTSKPFDQERFVKNAMPEAQAEQIGNAKLYVDARTNVAVQVANERAILFGPAEAAREFLQEQGNPDGSLANVAKLATPEAPISLAVNLAAITELPRQRIPEALQPLLEAKLLTATVEISKEQRIKLSLDFPSEEKAKEGEKAAKAGIGMARQALVQARPRMEAMVRGKDPNTAGTLSELPEAIGGLFGLAMIQSYDELLKDLPLERRGSNLVATLQSPPGLVSGPATAAIGIGLLLPAVQKVREAATRVQDANNLKQIAIAMHNYHDVNRHFPPAAICDKEGKPLLSWRVAILPYLEQNNLYQRFKMDEPWNGPNNRKLIRLMPKTYELPGQARPNRMVTHYRVFVGEHAPFDQCNGRRLADILDGTSNTLMVVESAHAVVWTKPDDLHYDPSRPIAKLGVLPNVGFNAAFMDGHVYFFAKMPDEKTLRALITHAGREVISAEH
jgi:hypothetical protein